MTANKLQVQLRALHKQAVDECRVDAARALEAVLVGFQEETTTITATGRPALTLCFADKDKEFVEKMVGEANEACAGHPD